jgi:hypothetical protein
MHNFTPEDLLEFHYGEMPVANVVSLKEALEKDWTLREKLRVIEEASNRLDKSYHTPRGEVIDRIMAYAEGHIIEQVQS